MSVQVGIVGIGTYLPKKVMTAKEISEATNGVWSEQAVRDKLGIVQKCVPKEQLMDTCMAIAQRIASRAPKSMTAIKNVIQTARKGIFGGSLLAEQENNNMVAATKDIKEGITALQEKRAPVFHNE